MREKQIKENAEIVALLEEMGKKGCRISYQGDVRMFHFAKWRIFNYKEQIDVSSGGSIIEALRLAKEKYWGNIEVKP
jgi:hypothetical protein